MELAAERFAIPEVAEPVRVRLAGTIVRRGDSHLLRGQLEASGNLICSRCLDPVAWTASEPVEVEIRQAPDGAADGDAEPVEGDEVLLVEGEVLDLAEVAVQQVLLALPMKVLCDEDCAGLCPRCGANRNKDGACRCEPEAADPRWEALRGLIDGSS